MTRSLQTSPLERLPLYGAAKGEGAYPHVPAHICNRHAYLRLAKGKFDLHARELRLLHPQRPSA